MTRPVSSSPRSRDDGSGHYDVIVVGSGFGGAFAAWSLVHQGLDVLMLERGRRVERGSRSWEPDRTVRRAPAYTEGPSFAARTRRGETEDHAYSCVGGASVYYGGVSLRFREHDFRPHPEIVTDSGARWPFGYATLRPYYRRAEEILQVAGRAGEDPCEPPREAGYPVAAPELSPVSRRMAEAARSLGLRPFRLPLALNLERQDGRDLCIRCGTCDTFACAIEAKNDVEVQVLRRLVRAGLTLRPGAAVTRLHRERGRITGVSYVGGEGGGTSTTTARRVILAGGALGSAHLLMSEGLEEANPAGSAVGRYLMRHCSAIVFGAFGWVPDHEGRFHKMIGLNDYYSGSPSGDGPPGPLGNIQQSQTPAPGTVQEVMGRLATTVITPLVRRATGLLVMAEDRPLQENGIRLDRSRTDEFGLPRMEVRHMYADRDLAARDYLARRAKEVHGEAGTRLTYVHEIDTFSHALGTVRMGDDPSRAPLDPVGRFRGVDGLYVSDGSALPSSSGVNPSLTIAANALRVGEAVVEDLRREAEG